MEPLEYVHFTTLRQHQSPIHYKDYVHELTAQITPDAATRWVGWVLSICETVLETGLTAPQTFDAAVGEIKQALTAIGATEPEHAKINELINPVLDSLLAHANMNELVQKLKNSNSVKICIPLAGEPLAIQVSKLNEFLVHYIAYSPKLINYMPLTMITHSLYNTLVLLLIVSSTVPETVPSSTETLFYHRAFSLMIDFLADRFYTEIFLKDQNERANMIKQHLYTENPNLRRILSPADLMQYPLDQTELFREHFPHIVALHMGDAQRIQYIYGCYHDTFKSQESQIKLVSPSELWTKILEPITGTLSRCRGEYDVRTIARVLPEFLNFTGDTEKLQHELTERLKSLH